MFPLPFNETNLGVGEVLSTVDAMGEGWFFLFLRLSFVTDWQLYGIQEQESAKRRELGTRLADAQRECDTAHKARLMSEKQLNDVRCLAISLEEQNRELRSNASQKESVLVR